MRRRGRGSCRRGRAARGPGHGRHARRGGGPRGDEVALAVGVLEGACVPPVARVLWPGSAPRTLRRCAAGSAAPVSLRWSGSGQVAISPQTDPTHPCVRMRPRMFRPTRRAAGNLGIGRLHAMCVHAGGKRDGAELRVSRMRRYLGLSGYWSWADRRALRDAVDGQPGH